ncbi:MAG: universal stress protein [Acidobacteria bacterium]|nr:universal stress protein [Acidobacteriota bacterium]
MFKNILVPVGLSERYAGALKIASDLARQNGGKVTLLHVIELIVGLSLEEGKDLYDRLEQTSHEHLDRLSNQLERAGIPFEEIILYGRVAQEIVRFAEENKSDLIVLASHRIDPCNPGYNWGTNSYKVGILAQCPVMLVK